MKKAVCFFILLILVIGCLVSCNKTEYDIIGKTYVYEKWGFGGKFTICFLESGEVQYYEGMLSSHIGLASWSREGNIVTIAESVQGHYKEYKFEVKKDRIEYIEKGSSNFMYMKLSDGARFFEKEGK